MHTHQQFALNRIWTFLRPTIQRKVVSYHIESTSQSTSCDQNVLRRILPCQAERTAPWLLGVLPRFIDPSLLAQDLFHTTSQVCRPHINNTFLHAISGHLISPLRHDSIVAFVLQAHWYLISTHARQRGVL